MYIHWQPLDSIQTLQSSHGCKHTPHPQCNAIRTRIYRTRRGPTLEILLVTLLVDSFSQRTASILFIYLTVIRVLWNSIYFFLRVLLRLFYSSFVYVSFFLCFCSPSGLHKFAFHWSRQTGALVHLRCTGRSPMDATGANGQASFVLHKQFRMWSGYTQLSLCKGFKIY